MLRLTSSHHLIPTEADGGKVWNPWQLDDARPLRQQLLDASDHFPVTLDIN